MNNAPRIQLTSNLIRRGIDLVRGFGTPEQGQSVSEQELRQLRYQFLYEIHNGLAYNNRQEWQDYNGEFGNYRWIRPIWSHAQRVTDFYSYRIYNGAIPSDGINLPEGVKSAVPLSPTMDPQLASAAAGMLMTWNWQGIGSMLVNYVAMLGELLVELKDDPDTGEVQLDMIWPGTVADIVLDHKDDIVSYVIEYDAVIIDPETEVEERFVYRREMDAESFRTFRDDEPYAYTNERGETVPAVVPNPYNGIVPGVWFRHIKRIGVRGEPAIVGTQAAGDEINSLLSHLLDKAHVKLASPVMLAGNIAPGAFKKHDSLVNKVKRTFTGDLVNRNAGREELDVITADTGTKMETLSIELADARVIAEMLIGNIEANVPEVTVYQEMRKMTQITGPGAMQLFGDIEPKFRSISSNYDQQLKLLLQKGIAIAGWRISQGDWDGTRNVNEFGEPEAGLTELQSRFSPYNLGSFAEGELYIDIMPRHLFEQTEREQVDTALQKKALFGEFIPPEQYAAELGYKDEKIQEWIRLAEERQAEIDKQMQQQAANVTPIRSKTPEERTEKEDLGRAATKNTQSQQRGGMKGGRS